MMSMHPGRKGDNPTRGLGRVRRRLLGLSGGFLIIVVLVGCGERERSEADIQATLKQLDSPRPDVRANAVFELGNRENSADKAIQALQEALKDKSAKVRKAAALSLMEIGNQARSAVPVLKEAYKNEQNRDVALAIASTLRQIAPQAAREMDLPYY